MGKVRIKILGEEDLEKDSITKKKAKRDQKKARLEADKTEVKDEPTVDKPDIKDDVIKTKKEDTTAQQEETSQEIVKTDTKEDAVIKKTKKSKFIEKKIKSKRYTANTRLVSKKTSYPIDKALEVLKKFQNAKFDETVELHVNLKENGVSGQVTLPHGTGKKLRIKIADDDLIVEIEKGKIDFDVLVSTPDMMPKLAKVARILGPRGLMPNPKNGTVTDNVDEAIKNLSSGQINFKAESKEAPVIHLSIGKVSFDDKKLSENIKAITQSVGEDKIKSITLKSTMSPGIKIELGQASI